MTTTSSSTKDADILAILTKTNAPRAVLVSLNRDGQLAHVPVSDAQSLINIKEELIDHLNSYPHSDEWLVGLRDYCVGRLADSPSYAKDIPADRADLVLQASWEIDSIARMTLEYLPVDADSMVYRALMRRCLRLASMVMSAIGELEMDTATLQSMFDDGEVSHG